MNIIKSDIIQLHGAANSMQGGRLENQDDMAFLDTPLGFLAIVCDGMGGGPGGKTASYIVKYEFASTLCECTSLIPRDQALKKATARANKALEVKMREVPSLLGMGSTFVAVLINIDSAFICHVGDSRCYLLRGGKCIYRSQDHSLVAELVKKKALSEEEARLSPQSNVITRGLGSTTNHVPEIEEIPYKKGDRIVLCTDGVWGSMPQRDIVKAMTSGTDIKQIVSNIATEVDKIGVAKGGNHDNHTIAIFDIEVNSVLKGKIDYKKIAIVCALICALIAIIGSVYIVSSGANKNSVQVSEMGISYSSNVIADNNTPIGNSAPYSSSANSDSSDSISATTETSSKYKNTDSLLAQVNRLQQGTPEHVKEEKDSISKKTVTKSATNTTSKSSEVTQKIINRYKEAKNVEGTSIDDAKKKLDVLHNTINTLMGELEELCKDNINVLPTVAAIARVVDNDGAWYVDKNKDSKTGKYKLTSNASKLIDKQIERLTNLKKRL